MKTLARWIGIVGCMAALTLTLVGQTPSAAPGLNSVLRNVYIRHLDRTVLGEDVIHYRFDVVVGGGKFDHIQLHRIVREKRPWQPIRTTTGLLMLPGGPNTVEMIFMEPLISNVPAWDQSISSFLAKNNIDVWAMDYRWALVPPDTKDFKFMKNWGLQRDVDDAKIALALARLIRGATGQGVGKLHLLGFSYGTMVAYPLTNQETQIPNSLRSVKGLIPVDWAIVYPADSPFHALSCSLLPQDEARYAAAVYNDDYSSLKLFGDMGQSTPYDPSPFADGFTNYQFALFVGASVSYQPSWHFVAGVFDGNGVTTGLQYTKPWLWMDVIRAVPFYIPVQSDIDGDRVGCYDMVAPFTDHLADITLPILYVGAAGGTGDVGSYAPTLTASTDFTKFTVQLHPEAEPTLDFGHADLFTATHAQTLVWQPILHWLQVHR